jgi:hypothetical protein
MQLIVSNAHQRKALSVGGNATSDSAKFNIQTKTNLKHNKICRFAKWEI